MSQGKPQEPDKEEIRLPRHIAVIMDGNGRWAKRRGLPRYAGHPVGVEAVRRIVEACVERGIEVLTLFAFSSENWQRPKKEVNLIMDLFIRSLKKEARRLHRNGVKLCVIGDRSAFSDKLQRHISEVESLTCDNTKLVLQVAANYGGRWDITQAARQLAERVQTGELSLEQITETSLNDALSFADLPEPDLFIRTGGEERLSNFLLWQCAYTELYFTDMLWPDFDAAALDAALADYANRQRRFGRTGEQVSGQSEAS
jgi:undecaprenyl diphosphate synthase